ncbi:hypothetical protein [Flavobacterium notoginsengisoli]|uniref:hypothetical protein n=1 Tax=Flavobacterium notoginsengisoli TaxID=1478199 RepID=UPI00362A4637
MLRKTFLIFSLLLLFCAGFITLGLYLMEIEDHYGDLQEVYFESQNGDLIINKQNQTFGIISKNWRRSNVITKQNDTLDLCDFIRQNKYEILRIEKELALNDLTFEKIIKLKNEKSAKSIINN